MKKSALILGMVLAAGAGIAMADDSLYVSADGNIGVGTSAPDQPLHVLNPGPVLYKLENSTPGGEKIRFSMKNELGTWTFDMEADASAFLISKVGKGPQLRVEENQAFIYVNGVPKKILTE